MVPSFFVGATFGCAVSPLLGLPVGFGAAIGLAAVFCGVTNCPVASTLLAVELFGAEGMLYFALACCLSYMLSGYQGLYSSQTILYSKLRAEFINVRTTPTTLARKPNKTSTSHGFPINEGTPWEVFCMMDEQRPARKCGLKRPRSS